MAETKPHKGTIVGWQINNLSDRPTVRGRVYGHPVIADGEMIQTSYIVNLDGDKLETRNTLYTLADTLDSKEIVDAH
jgi:hypothetical protein